MPFQDILSRVNQALDFRKEAEISGVKFGLRLLTLAEEQILGSIDTENLDGMSYFNETRKTALSYAIYKIDGEEVPKIVETTDEDGNTVTKERSVYLREFLDNTPTKLTDELFEMYVDLREQAETELGKAIKYDWYKDPAVREKERQEAADKALKESEDESEKASGEDDIELTKVEEPAEPETK